MTESTFSMLIGGIVYCDNCGEYFADHNLLERHIGNFGCKHPKELGMVIKRRGCGSFWGSAPIKRSNDDLHS